MPHASHLALKTLACLTSTGLGAVAGFNYVSSGSVLHTSDQPGVQAPTTISTAGLNASTNSSDEIVIAPNDASATPEQTEQLGIDHPSSDQSSEDSSCCETPASRASVITGTASEG